MFVKELRPDEISMCFTNIELLYHHNYNIEKKTMTQMNIVCINYQYQILLTRKTIEKL